MLHSNLCLLGVSDGEGAKGIVLTKTAFRKPNPKALELILYHAYSAVRGRANAKKVRVALCTAHSMHTSQPLHTAAALNR